MARSGRKAKASPGQLRWLIGGGALVMAVAALYVLVMQVGDDDEPKVWRSDRKRPETPETTGPALDDIDAGSREAMRDLLRDAE